jgi:hypothetical protein
MSFSLTKAVEALAAPVLGPLFGIIDQAVPDKDLAVRLKADIQKTVLEIQKSTLEAQAKIITAEAASVSWLPRNIRPLFLMTLLVGMVFSVAAGAFGHGDAVAVGWAAVPEAAWGLMQIGLGGYIAGRTIEKVAPQIPRWKRDKDYEN